jgi:hypothetical protein
MSSTVFPRRVAVKTFVDRETRMVLERLAFDNDRSLAAEVRRAVDQYVQRNPVTLGSSNGRSL